MRFKLMSLMIAIVAALSSCNRHESVLTGSYGGRVVAGQVVMASEVADNSPAGVEVAVVGTGMSATLAADGHFLFAGVPDDVELTFRRADGIDVRTRVAAAPSLFIELGKTTASNSGRRRGVGQKDPKPSQEIEGVIQTAGADSIVVLDSHQQLDTVSINDATLIRKGNQTLLAADLKEGDRVHVKAMLKDDKLTALQIVVQNAGDDDDDDDREHGQEVEGLIVKVSDSSITVHDSHKNDVDIAITSSTIIRKGNTTLTTADLKKDDRVHVKTTMTGGTLTATEIIVQNQGHGD